MRARCRLLRGQAVNGLYLVDRRVLLAVPSASAAVIVVVLRADGANDRVAVAHAVLPYRVDRHVHVRRARVVAGGADERGVRVHEVENARDGCQLFRLRVAVVVTAIVTTVAAAVIAITVVAAVVAVVIAVAVTIIVAATVTAVAAIATVATVAAVIVVSIVIAALVIVAVLLAIFVALFTAVATVLLGAICGFFLALFLVTPLPRLRDRLFRRLLRLLRCSLFGRLRLPGRSTATRCNTGFDNGDQLAFAKTRGAFQPLCRCNLSQLRQFQRGEAIGLATSQNIGQAHKSPFTSGFFIDPSKSLRSPRVGQTCVFDNSF